jgi:serine/threonine protein kinase
MNPSSVFFYKLFEVRFISVLVSTLVLTFSAHRLLWILGIAHSDISFHNLMLDGDNGILNDFDLASIMEPGETSPPNRRTGTSMFMSPELLSESGVKGLVPRRYRHELESFAWVLLYAAVCVTNDEENLNVSPFREWVWAYTSLHSFRIQRTRSVGG